MKLLVDTNLFLEVILRQERMEEARAVLSAYDRHELLVSDFTVHSIGVLLFREGMHDAFERFISDTLLEAGMFTVSLSPKDMEAVSGVARRFKLDFDDAYQYVVAQKHDLTIVSFDRDFDRTELGRKTPGKILET